MLETNVTIGVHTDPSYHYEVYVGDVIELVYYEGVSDGTEHARKGDIAFGSVEEMEAIALAMLRAVKAHRG